MTKFFVSTLCKFHFAILFQTSSTLQINLKEAKSRVGCFANLFGKNAQTRYQSPIDPEFGYLGPAMEKLRLEQIEEAERQNRAANEKIASKHEPAFEASSASTTKISPSQSAPDHQHMNFPTKNNPVKLTTPGGEDNKREKHFSELPTTKGGYIEVYLPQYKLMTGERNWPTLPASYTDFKNLRDQIKLKLAERTDFSKEWQNSMRAFNKIDSKTFTFSNKFAHLNTSWLQARTQKLETWLNFILGECWQYNSNLQNEHQKIHKVQKSKFESAEFQKIIRQEFLTWYLDLRVRLHKAKTQTQRIHNYLRSVPYRDVADTHDVLFKKLW